jgi:hypothetical protein
VNSIPSPTSINAHSCQVRGLYLTGPRSPDVSGERGSLGPDGRNPPPWAAGCVPEAGGGGGGGGGCVSVFSRAALGRDVGVPASLHFVGLHAH